jgi:hypothetical protein
VLLVVLLFMRSTRVLPAVMVLFAASNALDATDALAFQRWAQVPGAPVLAVAFAVAALWLVKQPSGRDSTGRRWRFDHGAYTRLTVGHSSGRADRLGSDAWHAPHPRGAAVKPLVPGVVELLPA